MATAHDHIQKFAALKRKLNINFGGAPFLIEITEENVWRALPRVKERHAQAALALDRYYGISSGQKRYNRDDIGVMMNKSRAGTTRLLNHGVKILRSCILEDWESKLVEFVIRSRDIPPDKFETERVRAEAVAGTIDLLEIKPRTRNCLINANLIWLADIVEKEPDWFLDTIPHFGPGSLNDLRQALHKRGQQLKESS